MKETLEYVQSPSIKVVTVENATCVAILEDWNVEDTLSGYTQDEVKSLIEMLQQSLSIMDKYNKANEVLPLFDQGEKVNVQQETPTQSLR
jgi:hypothetical protein